MLAFVFAAATIVAMSPSQLDREIAKAHEIRDFGARVERISSLFVGVPYGQYPLGEGGEGPEPQARWRVDQVDCQTFVETVLAMSNARSLDSAKEILDDIRYAETPAKVSFATRNHFTEAQWLPSNEKKGYLREVTTKVDPDAAKMDLVLHREDWTKVPGLKRLAEASIPDGNFELRYVPLDDAKKIASRIPRGTIVLIVRAADPQYVVRVSHMGLAVRDSHGKMVVRHASFGKEHQVIDVPVADFLEHLREFKKWPVDGVALVQPLDASKRVAQLAQR
ncbi:MAG: N-acetylmuramoyl-L-alanine amidase-like domain-containing protein [Myxococcales bacterium]